MSKPAILMMLLPVSVGLATTILSGACLIRTVFLGWRLLRHWPGGGSFARRLVFLAENAGLYGLQLYFGQNLVFLPGEQSALWGLVWLLLGAYVLGVNSAWQLLGARRLGILGWLSILGEDEAGPKKIPAARKRRPR